ncbi:MAG: hypothetical protein WCI77_00280 [Candidatus Omnitrophota bacterium]
MLLYGCVCVAFSFVLFEGHAQDALQEGTKEKPISLEEIKNTFVNTLNELETQKAQRAQQLDAQLQAKLQSVLNEWIESAKQSKERELNKLTHNTWKNALMLISPMPYDYYLRSYEYAIAAADIIKKDSPLASYGASAQVIEKLCIERYHSDAVSSLEPYLHTVSTSIKLQLTYDGDTFIIKEIEYGQSSIGQGW